MGTQDLLEIFAKNKAGFKVKQMQHLRHKFKGKPKIQ